MERRGLEDGVCVYVCGNEGCWYVSLGDGGVGGRRIDDRGDDDDDRVLLSFVFFLFLFDISLDVAAAAAAAEAH